ncbi:ferredoxin Fer [Halorubrum ezzemoulense]|uniref:Molecular chaperone DnaJ n=2 Tax=Halorubrum ezzemoulense TaxID=337243 RepID=A0A1X4HC33_HALEZ|nr:ferredoxin Fer [Halorubrum ezzemoulense]MDB2241581.1 ferredoxin Fer [Halorubrum ezzemoulense]MDB9251918.1 ferredoxin Fer [Halorubrum ezzemoulense]MDB9254552.1 ferredoxin Fer [Halorubrum ezzemoulense]MDB9275263.1 ferredoxin Fer [Halorubrum ezzemoulense]OSP10990.1 molecular chaperone DnaJ [Halorubrum ezzemoulense DSM 17463]
MGQLERVDADRLRAWLSEVRSAEATAALMTAVAYDRGIGTAELASWYDRSEEWVEETIAALDSPGLVSTVARLEGVDIGAVAAESNLAPATVRDWFDDLGDEPVGEAADVVRRYAEGSVEPVRTGSPSTVYHLDRDALTEHGWSLDDEDLFEKAADADLDLPEYGRFLVEPGESILEAAERGGRSWPYACRGGACSNCAVVVVKGDVAMPGQSILSDEQIRGANARLSCVGVPITDEVKIVTGIGDTEAFADLRLPSPTEETEASD